jgi:hypothetical protein
MQFIHENHALTLPRCTTPRERNTQLLGDAAVNVPDSGAGRGFVVQVKNTPRPLTRKEPPACCEQARPANGQQSKRRNLNAAAAMGELLDEPGAGEVGPIEPGDLCPASHALDPNAFSTVDRQPLRAGQTGANPFCFELAGRG